MSPVNRWFCIAKKFLPLPGIKRRSSIPQPFHFTDGISFGLPPSRTAWWVTCALFMLQSWWTMWCAVASLLNVCQAHATCSGFKFSFSLSVNSRFSTYFNHDKNVLNGRRKQRESREGGRWSEKRKTEKLRKVISTYCLSRV